MSPKLSDADWVAEIMADTERARRSFEARAFWQRRRRKQHARRLARAAARSL